MQHDWELNMRRFALMSLIFALGAVVVAVVVGCGGGGAGSNSVSPPLSARGSGRATFSIIWPERGRLIPLAANSIRVAVKQNTTIVAQQLLPRPTSGGQSSIAFDPLPVGDFTVTATAFPNVDGSGTAQATASIPLAIHVNQTTNFSLTMTSTIDHLELTAPGGGQVAAGSSIQLGVAAKDAVGAIILLSPSKLSWVSDNTARAVANATGSVTGVVAGPVNVSVTDQESGKSASVGITVTEPIQYFVISGKTYRTTDTRETMTAAFMPAEGGVTVGTYQEYVLLNVSGVGQAYVQVYNDAFWVYSDQFAGNPTNGHDGGYYQLAYSPNPLQNFDLANNVSRQMVGSVPPYNPNHVYAVILNTSLSNPGLLHFGVSDGAHDDNTGAFTIKVTQLVFDH